MSPHLDDAAFSLGASITSATRRSVQVDVVSVFCGDPSSTTPADDSNYRAGFETAGEAARLRRDEDLRACQRLGAGTVWLPLSDDEGVARDPPSVRSSLEEALTAYDTVLLPGFPLAHEDHRLVTSLCLALLPPGRQVGLYVEQPYASWNALGRRGRHGPSRRSGPMTLGLHTPGRPPWRRHTGTFADWRAKTEATRAYISQLPVLHKAPRTRIFAYEALHGGEAVAWLVLG